MSDDPFLLSKLPPRCFAQPPSTGETVAIMRGEMGYHPVVTVQTVKQLNATLEADASSPVPVVADWGETPATADPPRDAVVFGPHRPNGWCEKEGKNTMGKNRKAAQSENGTQKQGKESVLPDRVVQVLRYPTPTDADFTPTRFTPAATKTWFAVHYLRFVSCDFPRHQFTQRFYAQLMRTSGYIAHYDIEGFWTEFFTSTRNKAEFLQQTLSHPCYGQPDHTWSDVERLIINRLRAADILPLYQTRLRAECHAGERAELARLLAKYGDDKPDPGILRTVMLPHTGPAADRGNKASSQLAFNLG